MMSMGACKKNTSSDTDWAKDLDLLRQVIEYIETHYIDGLDIDAADIYAAYAVTSGLDNFSYLTDGAGGVDNAGIGIILHVTIYKEYKISAIIPNSPAAEEKQDGFRLERGDHIYAVNGNRVEGLNYASFQEYSSGGAGTELVLTIKRGGVILEDTYQYTKIDTTFPEALYINNLGGDISDDLGYIRLRSFTGSAAADFASCISAWREDGNSALILDLRNNAGGSSAILEEIASYFVPLGGQSARTVLEMDYKEGGVQKQLLVKVKKNNYIDAPLIILTNSATASASEALIGASRAFNATNTVVIGQPTYGKGVFQNAPVMLFDKQGDKNYAVYISIVTGYYYIVDPAAEGGRYNIHNNPILPDILVEFNDNMRELHADNEISAANNWFLELS